MVPLREETVLEILDQDTFLTNNLFKDYDLALSGDKNYNKHNLAAYQSITPKLDRGPDQT